MHQLNTYFAKMLSKQASSEQMKLILPNFISRDGTSNNSCQTTPNVTTTKGFGAKKLPSQFSALEKASNEYEKLLKDIESGF